MKRRCLLLGGAAALLTASSSPALAGSSDAPQKVLLYTYAQGFQHPSRYDAAEAIEQLGKDNDFDTFHLDDPSQMEDEDWLNQYDALIFISTSGKALTPQGAGAMRRYIEAGGGYMGIHEASDTAYEYPWYGRLVGAYFGGHPFPQTARYMVVDGEEDHPSVVDIPEKWNVYGEVYHFSSDPRKLDHTVVLTVDHGSYISNDMTMKELNDVQGSPHPIAWFKEGNLLDSPKHSVGGGVDNKPHTKASLRGKGGDGRSFYTALGHTPASWRDDDMLNHILGGIQWVLNSSTIASAGPDAPKGAPGTAYVARPSSSSSSNRTSSTTSSKGTSKGSSISSNGTVVDTEDGASSSASKAPLVASIAMPLLVAVTFVGAALIA